MELNTPSPVQELIDPLLKRRKVRIFIKREDQLHPVVSGNKWRKLKYNLELARRGGFGKLLTFGGAYSNHIVAAAFAAKSHGLDSIGVIRGERVEGNPSMEEAESYGMKLHFVSREDYAAKDSNEFYSSLVEKFGEFYLIPEGGANEAGVKGVEELGEELHDYTHIVLPVGTGATLAGIVNSKLKHQLALGFAVLKGKGYLEANVKKFIRRSKDQNWEINHEFHFGGYARYKDDLIHFINDFRMTHQVTLDPIYTGKMMLGIYQLVKEEYFPPGKSKIVAVHTGGLQGITGFNKRFGNLIDLD